MRLGVLRGVPRTPLVEPEGSRSTHRLGQLKNGPMARFLIGGEGVMLPLQVTLRKRRHSTANTITPNTT